MIVALALIVAFLIPLGFLWLVLNRNWYQRKDKYIFNIATVLWGLFAYSLAAMINSSLVQAGLVSRAQVVTLAAPIVEEILKSLILIYLVRRADFNYVVDGAVYGFGAGIGFAVIENYEYITGRPELALTLALSRIFSTNLVHATASGLIGSVLALGRTRTTRRFVPVAILAMIPSMLLHVGFNTAVSRGTVLEHVFTVGSAVGVGLVGAGAIAWIIQRGLKHQQVMIFENLGLADGVTSSEAAVVHNIRNLEDMLVRIEQELAQQFGAAQAAQMKIVVHNQAEIGLKRGLLEKMRDDGLRAATQAEIQRLHEQMQEARKSLGPYQMFYLRKIFLEGVVNWQDRLGQRLQAGEGRSQGGFDWRSELPNRIKQQEPEGNEP